MVSINFCQLNVVAYLLYAMGNTAYVESQRQASIALAVSYQYYYYYLRLTIIVNLLQVFVKKISLVEKQVQSILGDDFFQLFIVSHRNKFIINLIHIPLSIQSAPDKLYDVLTPSQIDVLMGCLTSDTQ